MELALIIYFIGFLGDLEVVTAIMAVAVILSIIPATFIYMEVCRQDSEEYVKSESYRHWSRFIKISLVFFGAILILPSEDTAYKMLAAYAGTEVLQMEETKEAGGKAYEALNKVLDDYLDKGDEK